MIADLAEGRDGAREALITSFAGVGDDTSLCPSTGGGSHRRCIEDTGEHERWS